MQDRMNVTRAGRAGSSAMLFVHGFGCDQRMWRHVAPEFEDDHDVVLLDLIGSGGSDLSAWDPERYATLDGYGDDVIRLCLELELREVTLVGHSVAAIIGVLAQIRRPDLVARLVLVAPSPRYLDDSGYVGGFSQADVSDLLTLMDSNHLGWQGHLATTVAGGPQQEAVAGELEKSFCRTRPDIARHFASVTFTGDNRDDLARVSAPTLVLQPRSDIVAPLEVGDFVHRSIVGSTLEVIDTVGHCPHLSAPQETVAAIRRFLSD